MGSGDGGDDVESCQRAGGGDGGTSEACQGVAIGMQGLLDQSEDMKALELSRHSRWGDIQMCQQVGAAPAVNVELAQPQSS